jgi:hypothetical protein
MEQHQQDVCLGRCRWGHEPINIDEVRVWGDPPLTHKAGTRIGSTTGIQSRPYGLQISTGEPQGRYVFHSYSRNVRGPKKQNRPKAALLISGEGLLLQTEFTQR